LRISKLGGLDQRKNFDAVNVKVRLILQKVLSVLLSIEFKKHWDTLKKRGLPPKETVVSWLKDQSDSLGTQRVKKSLLYEEVEELFRVNGELPKTFVNIYPELRFVHAELVKLHIKKTNQLANLTGELGRSRFDFMEVGKTLIQIQNDLKKAKQEEKKTKEAFEKFQKKSQKDKRVL